MNITGTSNTFSGTWRVVQGLLLGSGANSLGTNDITVDATGALETSYDLNSGGTLILDGQMFLHQKNVFRKVTIGGVDLADGTYTFAQLSAAYPNNFPATWTGHLGAEAFTAGSGSITVGGIAPPLPVTMQIQLSGSSVRITWPQGTLQQADAVIGPWTTNNASSPFTNAPTDPKKFYRIRVQ